MKMSATKFAFLLFVCTNHDFSVILQLILKIYTVLLTSLHRSHSRYSLVDVSYFIII